MKLKNKNFIPVIFGGDINAYTLARTFHEAYQIKSIVVSQMLLPVINNSQIIDNIIEPNIEKDTIMVKKVSDIAKMYPKKKLLLLGCADWYVEQITRNKNKFSKNVVVPYVTVNLMRKLRMKDNFYELCEELGVDYPKTFVYDIKQKNELDFDFDFPVVVKPVDGVFYHSVTFLGKKKGYKASSLSELQEIINLISKSEYNGKLIIQDFIPGDDDNMRVLTCYCDNNSKVKFYSLGNVLLEEHTPGAIGNHVAIMNEVNAEIFKQAKKFLEHVKFKGFANFDIKYDARDKKYKFFEINVRLGRSNYYVTGSGFNVAKYLVDDFIYNKDIKEVIADKGHLYMIVPKMVLFKYLKDKEKKKKVKLLIKQKKVCHPLLYKEDFNIKRYIYVKLALINQIRKYKKYYKKNQVEIKKEKTVGVIGGVGPLATSYFINNVIKRTKANKDQDHINMFIINHPTIPDRTEYILDNNNPNPAIMMTEDARKLENLGANFIVLPCNTAHYFYKYIQKEISIPLINIVEETVQFIIKQNPQIKTVGLLATDGTILSNIYQETMKKCGVKCFVPKENTQKELMNIIYEQVKGPKDIDIQLFKKIIKELSELGCEKIILGCTELSVINNDFDLDNDDIIDSLAVLIEKTILLSGKQINK